MKSLSVSCFSAQPPKVPRLRYFCITVPESMGGKWRFERQCPGGSVGAHPMMLFVLCGIRHLLQFLLSRTESAEGAGERIERNVMSELRQGLRKAYAGKEDPSLPVLICI